MVEVASIICLLSAPPSPRGVNRAKNQSLFFCCSQPRLLLATQVTYSPSLFYKASAIGVPGFKLLRGTQQDYFLRGGPNCPSCPPHPPGMPVYYFDCNHISILCFARFLSFILSRLFYLNDKNFKNYQILALSNLPSEVAAIHLCEVIACPRLSRLM